MALVTLTLIKALVALGLGAAIFYSADLLASPYLKSGLRTLIGLVLGSGIMVGAWSMMGAA
ncbi:MAG: hypothetical protein AAGJ32_09890 [Pseudomonadota bacterium]